MQNKQLKQDILNQYESIGFPKLSVKEIWCFKKYKHSLYSLKPISLRIFHCWAYLLVCLYLGGKSSY